MVPGTGKWKIGGLYENGSITARLFRQDHFPGFIDIHVHGWATGSFWFEKTSQSLREMCRTLPFAGVTYLGTRQIPLRRSRPVSGLADQAYKKILEGAQLLGVHLEGPFINPVYKWNAEK